MWRPLPPARRLPTWALAGALVALTVLQTVRRPSAPPVWDSLIAEDGKIFLSQALSQHFLDSLATSYQGYLHTGPRVIALVATWFPLEQAPLVMSLLTAVAIAAVALYVFEASAAWIASPLLRAVLALAVPFVPITARQMAGTVSNLHWYLLFGAFWAVVCPWRSRGWLAASTALVALAVLSDPQVAVLLPLALAMAAFAWRDWRGWVVPASIVAGLVVQFALRDEGTATLGGANYGALPRFFAERVTSPLFVGDRWLFDVLGGRTGSPFAWASLALVTVAIAAALWQLRDRRLPVVAGCVLLSIGFFLVAPVARGTRIWPLSDPWILTGTRYVYLPVLFLLTALLATVDHPSGDARARPRARELVVAAAAAAVMATGYAAPHRSAGELRWKPVVAQARAACRSGRRVGQIKLYGARPRLGVFIPIDPVPRWSVQVECSRV